MKPLLSEYYQYIFAGHARINLSHVPVEKQQQRTHFIMAGIREKFETITSDTHLALPFRRMLRQTGSELEQVLYGNQDDVLGKPLPGDEIPDDLTLSSHFHKLNNHYHFFKGEEQEAIEQFNLFFKISKIVNLYVEHSSASEEQIGLQAYKMLVWYGYTPGRNPFARVEGHLSTRSTTLEKPLYDSLQRDLPINDPPIRKLEQWRKLIELHGQIAIRLFQQAQAIEQGLKKSKLTLESAIKHAAALHYERAGEYRELASLCYQYHCSEEVFNKCLALKPLIKTSDRLPDILIDGNDFGYKGYCLLKMPVKDPHAYLLGDICRCGQSIGAVNEFIVREGLIFKNNGFLVLLKARKPGAGPPLNFNHRIRYVDYEIVAQGYLRNSISGLVLNSWESLRSADEPAGIHLLKQYGKMLLKEYPEYRLFSVGAGGKTPAELLHAAEKPVLVLTDPIIEGKQHLDSFTQFVLAQHNLQARRQALKNQFTHNHLGLEPDELAELIPLDNLYTENQFSSIETTIFDKKICQLIRNFGAENPEKFSRYFFNETTLFLGLLYHLKQLALTANAPLCFRALIFTRTTTIHTLTLLQQHHLLDSEILESLFSSQDNFKKITAIIHSLAALNALNPSTLDLLLNTPSETVRIRLQETIQYLAKKSHVFAEDFAVIAHLPHGVQQRLLDDLCLLSEKELFTTPNRRCLLAHPTHTKGLLQLFIALNGVHKQFIEGDYALLHQHMDKLPVLHTAALFLADKQQLNLTTWRTLTSLLLQKGPRESQVKAWLERHWATETASLSSTTAGHSLFIAKPPSSSGQDRDAPLGRASPPPL